MAVPDKVGQIEIQELLDESAEGSCYKGLQAGLGRTVAIRLLDPALAADEPYRARFLEDAKKAFKITSEGAARLIDVGHCKASDRWYLSYEFVSGDTAAEALESQGGKVDPAEVLQVGIHLCEALASAELQGLHHGDIRPEHVMFDSGGIPKLLDLGLAKRRSFKGSDPYVAPERIAGGEANAASDLYSLGATMYHLIAGKAPVRGKAPAYDVRRVNPKVSRAVGKIVWLLTFKDPQKRFKSAKEAVGQIQAALDAEFAKAMAAVPVPNKGEVTARWAVTPKKPVSEQMKASSLEQTLDASEVQKAPSPSSRFKRGAGFAKIASQIDAVPLDPTPVKPAPVKPAPIDTAALDVAAKEKAAEEKLRAAEETLKAAETLMREKAAEERMRAADDKLKAAEAMLKAAEEKLLAAEHVAPEPEPEHTPSSKIQRGSSYYGECRPTASTKRPEVLGEGKTPERPASGGIQRGTGYYDVMEVADKAKGTVQGAPKLSLDDPKSFQAGWDIFVREKGTDRVGAGKNSTAVRADHYFQKIMSTMEKVPAFELTVGPNLGAQADVGAPSQLLVGEDKQRGFKVERKLGQGAQGTVYKVTVEGEQKFDGFARPVTAAAVKMSESLEALLSERAIYSQPNPGVIKLLDFGRVKGAERPTDFLVLERLYPHPFQLFGRDGAKSPVDLATSVDTFVSLLMTLHELHYRKNLPLVLCDIKPDNIMLRMSTEDGGTPSLNEYLRRLATGAYEPVFLDMGCAQHHGELRKARGRLGCILGTPLYLSPEAAPSLESGNYAPGIYTAKLDVYSLTLTFYHYLTGVRPYTHKGLFKRKMGVFDELMRYKKEGIDPIDYDLLESKVGSHRMDDFVEILQKGLHPDPDYRANAKILFKLCQKKFKVVETRVRDISEYFYDDIKGLSLSQEALPRIRASFNMYLNPESSEFSEAPKARTRRFSRKELEIPDMETRKFNISGTGRFKRPGAAEETDESKRRIRGTGIFRRPKPGD